VTEPYTNCTVLTTLSNAVAGGSSPAFQQFTLTYTAQPADVGNRLGIFFNTASNGVNTYISFDNFALAGNILTLLTQPQSFTNYATTSNSLTVVASSGNQPITYQWQAGPVGGPFTNLTDGGNISGSTTPTLTINPTTAANAGGYRCHVADTITSTNTTEADFTVLVLTNLYFTTSAPVLEYGAPGVSYQVQVLADYQNGTASNSVTSSSLISYTIADAQVATVNTTGGITVEGGHSGPTTIVATYLGTSITQAVTLLQPTALWIVPSVTSYPPLSAGGPASFAEVFANYGTTYSNVNVGAFNDPLGPGAVAGQWGVDNGNIISVTGESSGGGLTPLAVGSANVSVSLTPLTITTNLTVVASSPLYELLLNAGFESPGSQKITWGFDAYGTNTFGVTDWHDAQVDNGSNYIDDGVESATPAVGSWAAYCRAADGGAYQIANYQINNGDTFYLIWSAEHTGGSTGASTEQVSLLSASATNTSYANVNILETDNSVLPGIGSGPGGYTNIYMVYQATANDAGKYVGVYFDNASAAGNNYAGFDNFVLAVAPISSAPSAPTGLTATAGVGSVTLNWAATGGAVGYYVKRSTISGTETTIANVATNEYIDNAVTGGTTYYYVVSATNLFGASTNSAEVSVVPLATVAPNPSIHFSASSLQLSWASGTLLQATNITGPWSPVAGANSPSFTITNYAASPQMYYRVSIP
jgi:hypothetical protein